MTEQELKEGISDIVDLLNTVEYGQKRQKQKELNWEIADQILSLFEPVELEALGNAEIVEYSRKQAMFPSDWSKATVQYNQSKGQLYRIRSEKE